MSIFMITRDAIQCRSHHMKQLKTFRNLNNIIKNYKKKIGEEEYREVYKNVTLDTTIFKEEIFPSLPEALKRNQPIEKKDFGVQVKIEKEDSIGMNNESLMNSSFFQYPQMHTLPYFISNTWPFYQQFT